MMKTLKILGLLLTYPSEEMVAAVPDMRDVLQKEKWLPDKSQRTLDKLLTWLETTDLMDVQEEYVSLFDRTPSLCLHLFEHIHGDSKDRGQALVDLSDVYEEQGLQVNEGELPDYLPVFLEYLSCVPVERARQELGETINILSALAARLQQRGSHYAAVFEALETASQKQPDHKAVEKSLAEASGAARSAEELDKSWEEQFAFEQAPQGAGDDGCPLAHDMVARMESAMAEEEK